MINDYWPKTGKQVTKPTVSHIKQISNYKRFLKQIIMAQREGEKTVIVYFSRINSPVKVRVSSSF